MYEGLIIALPKPHLLDAKLTEQFQKAMIGPLETSNGNLYMIIRESVSTLLLASLKTNVKNWFPDSHIIHIHMGAGETNIVSTTDSKVSCSEINTLRLQLKLLESTAAVLRGQLTETSQLINKDNVLAEALKDLIFLRNNKDVLEIAAIAAKELKTNKQLSDPVIQRLVQLHEKSIAG